MILGLLSITAAVYWPVHNFGFLDYDDQTYVWRNPHVLAGFSRDSLHYAFTASFGGWSPLVWISFLIDRQLFGATASGVHIENAGWHAVGGIMLWVLLSKNDRIAGPKFLRRGIVRVASDAR